MERAYTSIGRGSRPFMKLNLDAKLSETSESNEEKKEQEKQTTFEDINDTYGMTSKHEDYFKQLNIAVKDPKAYIGTKGKVVQLESNFIKIKLESNKKIFEYHITFKPSLLDCKIQHKCFKQFESVLGKVRAFNNLKLYLPKLLEEKVTTLIGVNPCNLKEEVSLVINFLREVEVKDRVRFFNDLFERVKDELKLVKIGPNHYDILNAHKIKDERVEIWPGISTNVQVYDDGLLLCLEVTSKVFRTDNVLQILRDYKAAFGNEYKEKFEQLIIGTYVITQHNCVYYRVDDISWLMTPNTIFTRNGKEMSYKEFYKENYNIEISTDNQPLLISLGNKKPRAKDSDSPMQVLAMIPEICILSGLLEEEMSNENIQKAIRRFKYISPTSSQLSVHRFIEQINGNPDVKEILSSWGLELENKALECKGRIIEPPEISINNRKLLENPGHDFTKESNSNSCLEPVEIQRWQVYCTKYDLERVKRMLDMYKSVAGPLGIIIRSKAEIILVPHPARKLSIKDFVSQIKKYADPLEIQFIICVAPGPGARDDLYAAIKRLTVCELGIPSQIIQMKTILDEKKLRPVIQKLALQINCKLGGAIWKLHVSTGEKYLFIGFDVNHDPKQQRASVLAIVGALNSENTRFFSKVAFQRPHMEMGETIKSLYILILKAYYEENGCWPDRIMVYRDGIGTRQFQMALDIEIPQVEAACLDVGMEKAPSISFLIVQKRIVERFFIHTTDSKYGNPESGTIVDHTITRKGLYDFFLLSQKYGADSASVPTHYVVLHDTSGFSPDMMQKFTYSLTFMYYNWSGPVRVPAVSQYAHKLAYLTGQYLLEEPLSQLEKTLFYI